MECIRPGDRFTIPSEKPAEYVVTGTKDDKISAIKTYPGLQEELFDAADFLQGDDNYAVISEPMSEREKMTFSVLSAMASGQPVSSVEMTSAAETALEMLGKIYNDNAVKKMPGILPWNEIKKRYPDQWLGLAEVQWDGPAKFKKVASARVVHSGLDICGAVRLEAESGDRLFIEYTGNREVLGVG